MNQPLALPRQHKPKIHINGRVSFPTIFQYLAGGELFDLPPPGGSWTLRIYDTEAYEMLARMGLIYSPQHTGTLSEPEDNRVAPGA